MNKIIKKKLFEHFKKVKLKKNSPILLFAGLNYFTELLKKDNQLIKPKEIFKIIKLYCGKNSTIIVPAFYYEFARSKKNFDIFKSPPSKSLGSIPQYVFYNENFLRSKHPLTSLMSIGKKSKLICERTNDKDYGYGSAWAELVNQNTQILFLGVPLYKANTFIHFIEFQVGVPHMYIKKYDNKVTNGKKIISPKIFSYVRYLNSEVKVNQKQLYLDLKKNKILKFSKVDKGEISSINCKDLLNFGLKKLVKNPYYFLNNVPKFKKGIPPLI
jgi:aminoglycoside 3-N-acetyltransferase